MKEKTLWIEELKVDGRDKPLGIDSNQPTFSWKLRSNQQNVRQKSYHLQVFANGKTVWDKGLLEDETQLYIKYQGETLLPETTYLVRLRVEDNYGSTACFETFFETGLLSKSFEADFITSTEQEIETPVLYKTIQINKKIKQARLYVSALGLYRFDINNKRVGDVFLAPFWTNYKKRLQYQTYDVTNSFIKGSNYLEMTLSGGWYSGVFGLHYKPNNYGDKKAGIAELHVTYADGTNETIKTDDTWMSKASHIISSNLYDGETWDLTKQNEKSFKTKKVMFNKAFIVSQESEPVRVIERLKPIKIFTAPNGEQVIDFGQNHSGFLEITIDAVQGQKIIFKFAEVLTKEGNVSYENLRQAKVTDTFILSKGKHTIHPEFTFHGYRYATIFGVDAKKIEITSFVISSDLKQTGWFETDNDDVNRLQKNIVWSQMSNFIDVPTDCPQRDERLGWTGDFQAFAPTAAFNRDISLFGFKWMKDLISEQRQSGAIPFVIPDIMPTWDVADVMESSAVWGDAATIVPWTLYEYYGNMDRLNEHFPTAKKWIEYIRNRTTDNLWMTDVQLGDWLALDAHTKSNAEGGTDPYYVANAYYLNSIDILIKMAKVLHHQEDYETYKVLYDKTYESFKHKYITQQGYLNIETQTAYVLALRFNLLKTEEGIKKAAARLKWIINQSGDHLLTGFAGTPHLCPALSLNGMHDLAGKLFLNVDYPSWLYPIKMGATTIWERWNSILPDGELYDPYMNSYNHYAYGSIGNWMYRFLGGINVLEAGFKKSFIKPMIIQGLSRVHAAIDTPYGRLVSSYIIENNDIKVHVEIPVNTRAILILPGCDEEIELESGTYSFNVKHHFMMS